MSLIDSFGRKITYLRLSVTDRCNLRCCYCMPAEGIPKLNRSEILSYEELLLLARTAVQLGIEKIRVTGGEPLVRKGILTFLGNLSVIPGLRRLALTTNGVLLEEMAEDLKRSGIQHLNISLDSMHPDTFARVTRCGNLQNVLDGIRVAEEAGFNIKINIVAMRGINDGEFSDFAGLTLTRPFTVRFIEYMPTMQEADWQSLVMPGDEIIKEIARHYDIKPINGKDNLSGPSRNFQIEGAVGIIGIITPITRPFCSECNRIRVTPTGMAKSCLFAGNEYDLKPLLRNGDETALREALREIVLNKPEKHLLLNPDPARKRFSMSKVGG